MAETVFLRITFCCCFCNGD